MTDGVITSHGTRTLTLANLGYTGATNANYITNNNQLTNGASYITNSGGTEAATGSTVVKRDSSADINVRLVRSNYTNQTTISGAMAFRVNNGSDNYTRFCSDGAAIRTFIGAGTSSFNGAFKFKWQTYFIRRSLQWLMQGLFMQITMLILNMLRLRAVLLVW